MPLCSGLSGRLKREMDTNDEGSRCSGWRRGSEENKGIMDERILVLVFGRLNWDPHVVCIAACVNRRLRAVANRVLWREVCTFRAPRMVEALTLGTPAGPGRFWGGWAALAKLLFYCCGGGSSRFFPIPTLLPGHFLRVSRFSKTAGRSFLVRRCWDDLLYVSDPCEHDLEGAAEGEDLGCYRGVFRAFIRSKTRARLLRGQAELEQIVRCPYCGARVWSMTAARLVPTSAARRLGSFRGKLEYFVCVNGHLHGNCWLAHLSTDEDDSGEASGNEVDGFAGFHVAGESEDNEDDDDTHITC
ncbi:hypothetical protein HPP92_002064 [Vanilla planifolia]|uniref:EID1-like F-box protein 3 n=1 Tax=Vanilla planifolia TaxID=51239 RepID=A0A835S4Q5_VANPL|nr:hypothetical protein HPP92_002064 [Vanilla planifolia]